MPTVKGRHTYTVRVPRLPDEKIDENNHRVRRRAGGGLRTSACSTSKGRCGPSTAPRPAVPLQGPRRRVLRLVQTRPNVFVQRTNIEGLKLDGHPRRPGRAREVRRVRARRPGQHLLKPAQMEAAHQAGPRRGRAADARRLSQPGAGRLRRARRWKRRCRCSPGGRDIGQVTEPFLPALTPDGRAAPDLRQHRQVLPDADGAGRSAPGSPRWRAACGGGGQAGRDGPGGHPPSRRCRSWPSSRSARAARPSSPADTTRNWQQAPRALDQESPFSRFWGQTVRWLANRRTSRDRGRASTARTDKALLRARPARHDPRRRPRQGRRGDRPRRGLGAGPTGLGARVTPSRLAPVPGSAGQLQRHLRAEAAGRLRDRRRGQARQDRLACRADRGRGRPAQPGIRPARPGRRHARRKSPRRRTAAISISATRPSYRRAEPPGAAPAPDPRAAALLARGLLGGSSWAC